VKFTRCKNCLIPNTKTGIKFDKNGMCQACLHAEKKKTIDWNNRFEELKKLCDKYRRNDGYYDCIITGSGGKDSYFQTYVMKELMGMNPLLVSVTPFEMTNVGGENFKIWGESFGCDIITLHLNRRVAKAFVRKAFEKLLKPHWYYDRAIYSWPLQIALKLNIPLVVYGENVNVEYGGPQKGETYSAKEQISNDVVKNIDLKEWLDKNIQMKDLNPLIYPTKKEMGKLEPIYISYFVNWNGLKNYEIAKRYGFKPLPKSEWSRVGYIEDYDQIDARGYLIDDWCKYPKYGFRQVTQIVGNWIRAGYINKEEGKKFIKDEDYKLDAIELEDFLKFTGYTHKEFWDIVEKFWNKDIFKKDRFGGWELKDDRLD